MSTPGTVTRLPHRVKRLYQLQAQAIAEALKPFGLARSQWQVLSHVSCEGTLTQRELQARLMVEPATLSGIVDGLVAKGWLERLENPGDKRVRDVRLTPAGEERIASIPDVVESVETRMLEGVSDRDRRTLERAIEKMTENLGRRPADQ